MAIQPDLKKQNKKKHKNKTIKHDGNKADNELGSCLYYSVLWIQEEGIFVLRGGGVSKEASLSGARRRRGVSRGRHTCSKRQKLLFFFWSARGGGGSKGEGLSDLGRVGVWRRQETMKISDEDRKLASRYRTATATRRGRTAPARSSALIISRPLPSRVTPLGSRRGSARSSRGPRPRPFGRRPPPPPPKRRASWQQETAYTAHADRSRCTAYCYVCYACYCCCLTLLSLSLLLLLPPPSDTLSSHPTLLPFSPPTFDSSCSLDANWTSSSSTADAAAPPCLTCDDDSSPLFSVLSGDPAAPPRSRLPILCRPWPSWRSLSSLLLCPPRLGDPVLSYASTLDHLPSGPARPRTLLRQQSLQQPLIRPPGPTLGHQPPTTSQSLGQLHTAPGQPTGGGGGAGRGEGGGGGGEGGGGGSGTRASVRGGQGGSLAGAGASHCRGGGATL